MSGDDIKEESGEEKEKYVFLDFNGKLTGEVFRNEVFLRIANLHKKNPLVQVNDGVFKGTFDHSLGTNLFFEEIEDHPPSLNAFEKQTPIYLKHILSETKVINLKPVKIPVKKVEAPHQSKKIEFNLDWDYNQLLEKFEKGTLKIEDMVKTESQTEQTQEVKHEEFNDEKMEMEQSTANVQDDEQMEDKDEESPLHDMIPVKMLESDYEKLQSLARRPTKRSCSPELVEECEVIYREAYDYHNMERQILQPSDSFRKETVTNIDESTLSDCIDIDRCVLYGIITPSSEFPRVLSKEEKAKLFTLENFDNLSLAARYYVLKTHVEDLEKYVENLPKGELKKKDEFGRTPKQTLEIYKRLTEAVKNRLQEIQYATIENVPADEGSGSDQKVDERDPVS